MDPRTTDLAAVAGGRATGGQSQAMGGAEEFKGGHGQCDCLEGTQNLCHAQGARSFLVTLCFFPPLSQVGACSPSPGQCHCPGSALGGWQHPTAGSRLLVTERDLQLVPGHARWAPGQCNVSPPGEPALAQGFAFTQQLCIALAEGVPWELSV